MLTAANIATAAPAVALDTEVTSATSGMLTAANIATAAPAVALDSEMTWANIGGRPGGLDSTTYVGDYFVGPDDLDGWNSSSYTTVTGDFIIDLGTGDVITRLPTEIGGNLVIFDYSGAISNSSLQTVTGELAIVAAGSLTSLTLSGLVSVGKLNIVGNSSLDWIAMNALETAGEINWTGNASFYSFAFAGTGNSPDFTVNGDIYLCGNNGGDLNHPNGRFEDPTPESVYFASITVRGQNVSAANGTCSR